MKIKLVFDSTIEYDKKMQEQLNIAVTPFLLIVDNKSYRDGIDMTYKEFYKVLADNKDVSTSQPNVSDTIDLFREILKEYDHVVYFTLPEALSGTYNAGVLAAREVGEDKVSVVDIGTGLGASRTLAVNVKKMISEKATVSEIIDYAKALKYNSKLYVMVRDTKQLKKSGRLSNMAASVFSLIKLHLGLELKTNGQIDKFTVTRTRSKLIKEIMKDALDNGFYGGNSICYIAHADVEDEAKEIAAAVSKYFDKIKIELMPFTSTLGAHGGDGSIGIQFVKNNW